MCCVTIRSQFKSTNESHMHAILYTYTVKKTGYTPPPLPQYGYKPSLFLINLLTSMDINIIFSICWFLSRLEGVKRFYVLIVRT